MLSTTHSNWVCCLQVKQRTLPKSISCGKTFRDHTNLHSLDKVHYWLLELAKELEERVGEDRKANARLPQLLTVNVYSPPAPGQTHAPSQVGGSLCLPISLSAQTVSRQGRKASARLPQLLTVNVHNPPAPGQASAPAQVSVTFAFCMRNPEPSCGRMSAHQAGQHLEACNIMECLGREAPVRLNATIGATTLTSRIFCLC